MGKPTDQNAALAAEDAEAAETRNRTDAHQAALAAEAKDQRTAQAKAAVGDPAALVEVTITKFGEGKVSSGEHIATVGDVKAKKGDKLKVSPEIAAELETRGFAETA